MADIKEIMQRKVGPAPVYIWVVFVASVIAGFLVFKGKASAGSTATGPGAASGSPAGEFTSGQSSTTTDAQGNQTTTQYNASGPLTGFPGYVTNQAGAMPYSGGDVYVNYPDQAPPAQQTTTAVPDAEARMRQKLDPKFFNAAAGWLMAIGLPGETWKDVTARVYGFADNYADITDPAAKARVDQVSESIRNINNAPGSASTGPQPWSVVFFN